MIYSNSDSPFKISGSEFGSNLTLGTTAISLTIFIIITFIAIFSSSIYTKLPAHQQERIMVLFGGEAKYRDTSGYNLLYSKTAIGSGDIFGIGYLQETVKMRKFVHEQSTD